MDAHMSVVAPTFIFDDRKRFDAQCEHDRIRSSLLSELDTPPTADPWKQRPIDFTMKNFHPNRKRVSKEPSSSGSSAREKPSQISRNPDPTVMDPFGVSYKKGAKTTHRSDEDDGSDFELDTRVKYDRIARMLNTEQYKNPTLHDYRQYPDLRELGLPEFQTKYNRDPYNIQFLSDRLNMIWLQERENELRPTVNQVTPEMYRPLTAQPKWATRLILPKLVYPNKYAAFTRFRNPTRTVQSAYWERVDDHLGHPQQQQQHEALPKKRLNAV